MSEIFTVGYEHLDLDTFVALLRRSGIERVIDARAEPRSRHPGFSRGPLSARLALADVDYRSVPQAGAPKTIRTLERESFIAAYREHVAEAGALELVLPLLDRRSALLCRESDPAACHRSILAAGIMERTGADVRHLRGDTPVGIDRDGPTIWFTARNRHTEDCGEPPIVAAGGDKYSGYFENEFGEQAVFRFDQVHGVGSVQLGDAGWDVVHPVKGGIPGGGLIVTPTEQRWLEACWEAATVLRPRG
jgi:hypothetical protein